MNSLEIIFQQRIITAKPDNRYRILVDLKRADRPRHWNVLCLNCGSNVGTLMNQEIVSVTDFFDPANPNNHGYGRHCKGTLPDGLPCPFSYFFSLN